MEDPAGAVPPRIEEVVRHRVLQRAGEWFPDRPTGPVRVRLLRSRPRSVLFAVHLGESTGPPRILAKVRRDSSSTGGERRPSRRPVLATAPPLGAEELTSLEFQGLQRIHRVFGDGARPFAAIRPLDHLAEVDTILMDFAEGSSLREVLLAQSRLPPRRRRAVRHPGTDVWAAAGTWLRVFQESTDERSTPARQSRREEVVERFQAYEEFLAWRLGGRPWRRSGVAASALANDVLPERLPMAVGHGDFAPRNLLLTVEDRLVVLDPLPRWTVPAYEDLARLLVGIRLVGAQVHSHGIVLSGRRTEQWEQAVIRAYVGDGLTALREIRCYQLLVLLDKWAALVDGPRSGPRNRAVAASVDLATGYLRREAVRLVGLTEADA